MAQRTETGSVTQAVRTKVAALKEAVEREGKEASMAVSKVAAKVAQAVRAAVATAVVMEAVVKAAAAMVQSPMCSLQRPLVCSQLLAHPARL